MSENIVTESLDDFIINFTYEPPPPPEFRLYYDESGKVLFYTCDKVEGQYIIVDAQAFAEARQDVKVVDEKIVRIIPNITIAKLKPSSKGTNTFKEDISIIVQDESKETQKWALDIYELE